MHFDSSQLGVHVAAYSQLNLPASLTWSFQDTRDRLGQLGDYVDLTDNEEDRLLKVVSGHFTVTVGKSPTSLPCWNIAETDREMSVEIPELGKKVALFVELEFFKKIVGQFFVNDFSGLYCNESYELSLTVEPAEVTSVVFAL